MFYKDLSKVSLKMQCKVLRKVLPKLQSKVLRKVLPKLQSKVLRKVLPKLQSKVLRKVLRKEELAEHLVKHLALQLGNYFLFLFLLTSGPKRLPPLCFPGLSALTSLGPFLMVSQGFSGLCFPKRRDALKTMGQ